MKPRIEKRLVDAVLLVLASSGCWSSAPSAPAATEPTPRPTTQTPTPTTTTTTPTTTSATTATTTTVTSTTTAAAPPPPPATPGAFDPRVATDPRGFCLDYKKRTKVDKKKATNTAASITRGASDFDLDYGNDYGAKLRDDGRFDGNTRTVACTLVHERIPSQRQATHTPTCCPSGRGNTPCPPSQTVTVTDYKLLVERVNLRVDGSLASSTLTWQLDAHRFERHNCGRRPEGLVVDGELHGNHTGTQLALMAELEAASVPAFERLARELAFHGAPASLVARAQRAMRDEIRHARTLGALARRHGCEPRSIVVPTLPCRSLAAIGRENAVEGCVREAFGALIATFQAERAAPELRAVFGRIASDERRHAALAEAVDDWITGVIGDDDARDSQRAHAIRGLWETLPAFEACDELGLPGPAEAGALFAAYFA